MLRTVATNATGMTVRRQSVEHGQGRCDKENEGQPAAGLQDPTERTVVDEVLERWEVRRRPGRA
ncbi:MAG TPA: hypothetical protein VFP34_03130 [Microlunatus sp.]|nr:hypothetical protein [Microlunatus sp.]